MTQEVDLTVSDRLQTLIETYAFANGLTNDEAASELLSQAIAKKFKRTFNCVPATVYQFKPKAKA